MVASLGRAGFDDPRRLRDLLDRMNDLARDHEMTSVVVGIAGREGDLMFPEVIDFVESTLRMEDSIFRLTRERAVLFLADVGRAAAEEIVGRIAADFQARFGSASPPEMEVGYFEIGPARRHATVKDVLPALFAPAPTH